MQQPLNQKSSKKIGCLLTIIVILISALGLSTYTNISVYDLMNENQILTTVNQDLTQQINDLTAEFHNLNQSYYLLKNRLEPNNSPIIETRLGIKMIDIRTVNTYAIDNNYLWVTGEIENKENVTVYDTTLNFTLYTNKGVDVDPLIIGTLEPHQIIEIKTTIQPSSGKILNWTLNVTSSYSP